MHVSIVIYMYIYLFKFAGKSFFNYHGLNMHRLRVFRATLNKQISSVIIFITALCNILLMLLAYTSLYSSSLALHSESPVRVKCKVVKAFGILYNTIKPLLLLNRIHVSAFMHILYSTLKTESKLK